MGHKLNNAVIKQLHTATTIIFVRDPIATHVAKERITHTQQFYPMIRAQHIALGTVSYVRPSKRIESMARGVYVANIFFPSQIAQVTRPRADKSETSWTCAVSCVVTFFVGQTNIVK